MLTESEQDIIRRWNDFYLNPRQGSVQEQRKRLADYFVEFNANPPAVGAYHEAVALKAGLTADIAVPAGDGPHPVVIYIHGGAWTLGSPATHRKLVKQFAEAGYLTIAPDYRLAPEHPFPAGFDDCVFTAQWAAENAQRYGGDGTRLAGQSCDSDLRRIRFCGSREDCEGGCGAARTRLSQQQLSGVIGRSSGQSDSRDQARRDAPDFHYRRQR